MNGYQRLLQLFSIFAIILGAVVLLGGAVVAFSVFSVTGNPESMEEITESLANEGMEDVTADDLVETVGQSGAVVLLIGGFVLATGIFGIIGARDPKKIIPAYVCSIIGLVAAGVTLFSGVFSMFYGAPLTSYTPAITSVLSVCLMGVFLWLTRHVKKIVYL